MNGNDGVVNGVVMPAISIHTMPKPARATVLSVDAGDGAEARAEVVLVQLARRVRVAVAPQDIRACWVARLKTAAWSSTSVDGKFSV